MKKIRLFLIVFFLFASCRTGMIAQESVGVIDNYSGSASMWLNPSNLSSSFVYADFSLASIDFSVDNNFLYLPSYGLRDFFFGPNRLTWQTFPGKDPNKEYGYLYFSNLRDKMVSESSSTTLPSFMTVFKKRHAIGFSLKQRAYTSARKVPWEIPVMITESIHDSDFFNTIFASSGLDVSTLEWGEASLAYAVTAYEQSDYKVDLGVTAKLLLGFSGLSAHFDSLRYEILNDSTLYAYTINGLVKVSAPLHFDGNLNNFHGMKDSNPYFKGLGAGFDFGFNITRKKNANHSYQYTDACTSFPVSYYWKLGVSLLDVGAIKFSQNAMAIQILQLHNMLISVPDVGQAQTINEMMSYFTALSNGSFQATNESVVIGLPSAFSLQYDLNVMTDIYLNTVWIQPVKLFQSSVSRASLLCVTPRYETRNLGLALPISFRDYHDFSVGFSGRVGPLTFGVGDLISLAGLSKLRSLDLYLSIRFKLDRGNCFLTPLRDACGDLYLFRK